MSNYLSDMMKETDYKRVIYSAENLGNNPKRETIEALLQQDGGTLPVYDVSFFLYDTNEHNMQITYIQSLNEYFYSKMTMAK